MEKKVNLITLFEDKSKYFTSVQVLFIILLPYATFGLFQSDVSPFYLLGLTFLFFRHKKRDFHLILIVILGLIISYLFYNGDVQFLKFIVTIPLLYLLINLFRHKQIFEKHLLLASIIWFLSGLVTLIDVDVFSFLNYRVMGVAASASRGAIGFLPEPAYYGNSSVFLFALAYDLKLKSITTRNNLTILFFVLSVLISLSAFAFFMFFLVVAYYFTYYRQYFKIFVFIILSGLTIFIIVNYFGSTRISQLFILVLSNPELLFLDQSIRYRVLTFVDIYNALVFDSEGSKSGITSGLSLLVFNMNYISLFIILPFFYALRLNVLNFKNLFFLLTFLIVAFVGPISIPHFWLWISSKIYINNNAN